MSDLHATTPKSSPKGQGPTQPNSDTAVTELLTPVQPETPAPLAANAHAANTTTPDAGAHAFEPGTDSQPVAAAAASTDRTTATAPAKRPKGSVFGDAPERTALVVLVGMVALAIAFIVMVIAEVTNESINALAVIATPIAAMVAAYYGITLSIQQVKNERAEKEKALARADAAVTASRETEVWAAQMESGLRVAMAKLNAAGVSTDEVIKAAGTPDDFF
ncbi:MAG: hypothetical protein JWQ59_225 [Cryobacterium sp.]|jgi:hypothetical protein|nr:hypothetical protein [Cryobacterium sp.]